jgi:hypothetical protein
MTALVNIPVAVVLERREVVQGRWRVPKWTAVSTLPGAHLAKQTKGRVLIRSEDGVEQYLCSGLGIALYRDSAESYWYNLTGENASLFVVCHESPDGGLEPVLVTADHDEAMAGLEADDHVFSTAIPAEIYQAIERFVVENYVPEGPRKRKRKNWSDRKE